MEVTLAIAMDRLKNAIKQDAKGSEAVSGSLQLANKAVDQLRPF